MKTLATLSAAALLAASLLASPTPAEARGEGAVAAGVIGGLALGALIGAAASDAHAAHGYGYGEPAYDDVPPPVVGYRPARYPAYGDEDDFEPRPIRRIRGYDGPHRGWPHRHCEGDERGW